MKEFGTIGDLINAYKAIPCDAYILSLIHI